MDETRREAFLQLYRTSHYYMRRKALYYFSGNEEAASDFLQELYLQVARQLEVGNEAVLQRAYLSRMAANLFIGYLRKLRSAPEVFIDVSLLRDLFPEELSDSPEGRLHFHDLFRRLPQRLQVIALLRFIEGYSLAEITNLTHIPERTLRRRLKKITRQLKLLLK